MILYPQPPTRPVQVLTRGREQTLDAQSYAEECRHGWTPHSLSLYRLASFAEWQLTESYRRREAQAELRGVR